MDSERMLSIDKRYSIYSLLQNLSGPKSKRIRVQLSLLIAYYVLPVWNRVWPDDELAETALTKAAEVLGDRQNLQEAEAEAEAEAEEAAEEAETEDDAEEDVDEAPDLEAAEAEAEDVDADEDDEEAEASEDDASDENEEDEEEVEA
jgi:hypothetical protein